MAKIVTKLQEITLQTVVLPESIGGLYSNLPTVNNDNFLSIPPNRLVQNILPISKINTSDLVDGYSPLKDDLSTNIVCVIDKKKFKEDGEGARSGKCIFIAKNYTGKVSLLVC